uniref:Protein FAR1-RELATED SEQUENCE n=1 Tax=Tanacetum cinerariifolium TaxID=118510 RepID=A0A6L2LGT9_TANCI|nr:hypothetical protein [Tanacetum cinerariifolium]
MEKDHSINVIELTKLIDLNKQIVEQKNEVESNGDNILPEVTDPDTVMEEVTVEGTYYDTIDEAIDMYTKYADMAGFQVKKSRQRLTKSGAVQHKYIMCNREGVPKGTKNYRRWFGSMFLQTFSPIRFSMSTHILCVQDRDINVIPKKYILRHWIRGIIPPDLRRQRNRYGKKILTIERLTNKANLLVDDCLFLLSKDEGRMATYVEKLKKLLNEVKADMPNPPSRHTGDVMGGIFSISKPNQVDVKNPTKAVNKGEHFKKGKRLKSEREKAIKVREKKIKVCGYSNQKTNEHTKTTCPHNPKARKKKKTTPIVDV